MDPLDMTHFHSVVRPGAATLARTPEMRVIDGKSFGLAAAVHSALLLVILIAAWLKPIPKPPPYLEAEIYFSNLTYPLETIAPQTVENPVEEKRNNEPTLLRDAQSNETSKGVIAAKGKPIPSTSKTDESGANGAALDPSATNLSNAPTLPWEFSPQISRPPTPPASTDPVITSKKPAPPEVAKATPIPGPEVKKSTSLGPQSDRVAPPRMGGEGVILVAPFPYFKPRPAYPVNAMKNGLEGSVVVRVVVSATGTIIEAKVSQSSGSVMLDEAARRGVLMWKFHPGRQASGNVTTAIDVPIDFTLPSLNANGVNAGTTSNGIPIMPAP